MGAQKTCLGVQTDFEENAYAITDTRIESILNIIENILSTLYTGRRVTKLVGSVVSPKFVLGDIIQQKTKYLYFVIEV